jgi:hypothetical protein
MTFPSLTIVPPPRHARNSIVWVRKPSGRGGCGLAMAQASLPLTASQLAYGDRIGTMIVAKVSGPYLEHPWRFGWQCECPSQCRTIPWGFGAAKCHADCQCEGYTNYYVSLHCDCGNDTHYHINETFIPPKLSCSRECQARRLPAKPDDRQAA